MEISFSSELALTSSALVTIISDQKKLPEELAALDKKSGLALSRALNAESYKAEFGQTVVLSYPSGLECDHLILISMGKEKEFSELKATQLGGKIAAQLLRLHALDATIFGHFGKKSALNEAEALAHIAHGAQLRNYRFDKYRTIRKETDSKPLQALACIVEEIKKAKQHYQHLEAISSGVYLARDVVTEPPNVIYPESLAARCKELSALGVEVQVLGEEEMRKLGMGALLGVGQGSVRRPKLVTMYWKGALSSSKSGKTSKQSSAPLAFVGKGVTFDTGGISLKPANGMEDMKYDMGGSAVVIGLLKSVALAKLKTPVVGVVGLVENMPDGAAQRPSDVVTSMSGQTIEVLNTDAEGRLVLADALWYCQDRFKPKYMIDLATLTGAITVTFSNIYAGLFSNDETLAASLIKAGQAVGERVWQLPLGDEYDRMILSKIADIQNISNGKGGGSITAAQFLQRFVNNTPWAHLDIAGVTWTNKDTDLAPEGATAFGVRLLHQWILDQ
jgi:leucyl aminopeptidase